MRAVFTTAIRYKVNAVCETPLRTGGAAGNTESVLRDSFGNAFLQGSSLAGALRNWLENNGEQKTAKALFGSQEHEGRLIVSDAVLRADAEQAIRPRLRIDEKNGTAADKGKFDVAHIVSGSQLDFELTWLGNGRDDEEIMTVERMLGAVNSGEIRLGAQKSNGFGRLTLCVRKRSYDLMNKADRAAWIEDRDDGDEIKLPENVTDRRVTFVLEGIADSVLIRASAPVYEGDQSYTVNIEENGHPILPGSSIKGALRAQCMRIVQRLQRPRPRSRRAYTSSAHNASCSSLTEMVICTAPLRGSSANSPPLITPPVKRLMRILRILCFLTSFIRTSSTHITPARPLSPSCAPRPNKSFTNDSRTPAL